uniref:Uncharacterized protein n=1 Tax=Arundo donax TaxID=35708 RepID=A0A0A9AX76_ARUDO
MHIRTVVQSIPLQRLFFCKSISLKPPPIKWKHIWLLVSGLSKLRSNSATEVQQCTSVQHDKM